MKKIAKNRLSLLWPRIALNYQLFLPIAEEKVVNFSRWEEGAEVDLATLKTANSPKDIIFPQTETYLHFKQEGKRLELAVAGGRKDYLVFGARPCDVASINLLDKVFLDEPVDQFYQESRKKGVIIARACLNPAETCFCSSFKINPALAPPGADIATWDLGDLLLWEAQSEKGEDLTADFDDLLEEVSREEQERLERVKTGIAGQLDDLPLVNLDPDLIEGGLNEIFASEIWEQLYRRCLGCAICTYVCPTCHCYDLKDYDGNKCGERFRCWDSCMFSDFTMMAHGNPRTTQKERVRQRFMHKLVYYPNNYQAYACVGCGRCTEKCPVSLDMVKVIKKLGGERNEL